MAQLPWAANTEENAATLDDYSPIPSGRYPAMIVKSEYKKTKAGDGSYLQLNIKIHEGKHKGKMVFDRLNLNNPNPVAVEIANKALNTICQACGKVGVQDSEELHGIPMTVTVRFKPETAANPASNDITYYAAYDPEEQGPAEISGEVSEGAPPTPTKPPVVKPAAKPSAPPVAKKAPPVGKQAPPAAAKPAPKKLPWEK